MTNEQHRVLAQLRKAAECLTVANVLLAKLNNNGKQFDYVNCPRLSDAFSPIDNLSRDIEKKIYQK